MNDFLKILTAQLQYQDPLNPAKPDEFLSQLAQMTQVQELQTISETLTAMKTASDTSSVSQWVSAIGKKMNVDTTTLSKGDQVSLTPASAYDQVILTLTNTDGSTSQVTFNSGDTLAYTNETAGDVTVAATALKDGKRVTCSTSVYRGVQGVQLGSTGVLLVAANGDTYSVDKVTQIKD
jgi:flagellar basal-body rod modification protein FlgD